MNGLLGIVTGVIGMIFYPMFSIIFLFIGVLQHLFEVFAGTGSLSLKQGWGWKPIGNGNTGAEDDTGIVYYFLTSPLIKNLFISILILAFFLIIIFTAMAFIKNAYSAKQKSWQDIVGSAFKGIINFIFIPVCCLLGVWLGNILLQAIAGATSQSNAKGMAGQLFVCSAYNANRFRLEGNALIKIGDDQLDDFVDDLNGFAKMVGLGDNYVKTGQTREYYCEVTDTIFGRLGVTDDGLTNFAAFVAITNPVVVSIFYDISQINYVILIAGGIFIMYVLVSLAYGMIRRMLILMMLFVISPAMCAMYPLDDGKAVGNWKTEFVKTTISAYGAVAGMNLFFSLSPLLQQVRVNADVLGLIPLILTIAGLFVTKEFISIISGYIGADNAFEKGVSMRKSVREGLKKPGQIASKVAGGIAGAKGRFEGRRAAGATTAEAVRAMFGDISKSSSKTFLGLDTDSIVKSYKDSKKNADEHFNDDRNESAKKKKLNDDLDKVQLDENKKIKKISTRLGDTLDSDGKWKGDIGFSEIKASTPRELIEQVLAGAQGRKLEDAEIDGLINALPSLPNIQNYVAEQIREHNNRYSDHTTKAIESSDKVKEDHTQRENARNAIQSLGAEQTYFDKVSAAAADALAKLSERITSLEDFRKLETSDNVFFGGKSIDEVTRLPEEQMRRLEEAFKTNPNSNEGQQYSFQLALQEYDKLKQAADEMEDKVRSSAKSFADAVERAAQAQAEKNKQPMMDLATSVKNMANSADNLAEVTDKVKEAMEKIKDIK